MHRRSLLALTLAFVLAAPMLCFDAMAEQGPALRRILDRGELVLGTTGTMPPLNMATNDGTIIGMEIDLARALADGMGVALTVKTMPFIELLPALEAGQVDMVISGMTITPRRNLNVAFVGPYMTSGKCFLTKEAGIGSAKSPGEVNRDGRKMTALAASTSQALIQEYMPDVELIPAEDYDTGVALVIANEVDAMVADYPICAVSLMRYPEAGLFASFTVLTYEPLGIALPANDPHLVNWLDNTLRSFEGSGVIESIRVRWFESADWLERLP